VLKLKGGCVVAGCSRVDTLRRLWPFTSLAPSQLRELRFQAEAFTLKANDPVCATRYLTDTYYIAGGEVVVSVTVRIARFNPSRKSSSHLFSHNLFLSD